MAPLTINSFSMAAMRVSDIAGPSRSKIWALHYVSTASAAPSLPRSISSKRTNQHGGLHSPRATGNFFGYTDFKGRIALWVRMQEAYLCKYVRKNGDRDSVWRVMRGLKEQKSNDVVEGPYSDTLPQELIDRLFAPEMGDPALLEELNKLVEDNRVFKEDMLALLNYLASDQCVRGYYHLVAGYEA